MATKEKIENSEVETEEVEGRDFGYIFLPLLAGKNANQQEFFSVNFKNYLIQRGVRTKVPIEVYNVWADGERARNSQILYANEVSLREPQ